MNEELRSFATAGASGLDASLMELDESLRQRESDSEAGVGPLVGSVELREGLEDLLQHFRRNPDAVVANGNDCLPVVSIQHDLDPASRRGVFDGVVQNVRHFLIQEAATTVHMDRDLRGGEADLM